MSGPLHLSILCLFFHKRQRTNDCRSIRSNLKAFLNAWEVFNQMHFYTYVFLIIGGNGSDFENSLRISVSDKSSRIVCVLKNVLSCKLILLFDISYWFLYVVIKLKNYFVLNGIFFSNLALAKLVAVCVKAGKLLGRTVLTICTPRWAPRSGCPGWPSAPGRAGGLRSQSGGQGISSRDRACCSWCGTFGRRTDTDRVSHLHRDEYIMYMWHF